MNPLSRGLLEMIVVVGAFLALGLAGQPAGPGGAYPRGMDEAHEQPADAAVWLVDGYNVLCTGLLGGRERSQWWTSERREELLRRLEGFDDPDAEIWVVFDGRHDPPAPPPPGARVHAVFAPSADAWLVDEVRRRAGERPIAVVTADRRLAGRARHRGARVVAPVELIGRCMG